MSPQPLAPIPADRPALTLTSSVRRSFIPETMGLSLEQVDILYRNSTILGSNKFRKQILAENIQEQDWEAYAQGAGAAKADVEAEAKRGKEGKREGEI